MGVREATAEIEPVSGAVFLLAGSAHTEVWSGSSPDK